MDNGKTLETVCLTAEARVIACRFLVMTSCCLKLLAIASGFWSLRWSCWIYRLVALKAAALQWWKSIFQTYQDENLGVQWLNFIS